jgi:hypothetical protein
MIWTKLQGLQTERKVWDVAGQRQKYRAEGEEEDAESYNQDQEARKKNMSLCYCGGVRRVSNSIT